LTKDLHYTVDEKQRNVLLTEEGYEAVEDVLQVRLGNMKMQPSDQDMLQHNTYSRWMETSLSWALLALVVAACSAWYHHYQQASPNARHIELLSCLRHHRGIDFL